MIHLIQSRDRMRHPGLLDAMYRSRAVECERLFPWTTTIQDGRETDRYDALDPLYLLCVGECGAYRGSLRLMPTTGGTLLGDTGRDDFDAPVDIRSATIWDMSKLCIPQFQAVGPESGIDAVGAAVEMFGALCTLGVAAGLSQIIGVYDARLFTLRGRIGWAPVKLAASTRYATAPVSVGLLDITATTLGHMRHHRRISGHGAATEPPIQRLRAA